MFHILQNDNIHALKMVFTKCFFIFSRINYSFQAFAAQDDGTTDQATLTNGNEDLEMKSEDRTINCVIINFQILIPIFGLLQ
jgi:hypothetical protein